jgi:hypothetical protein
MTLFASAAFTVGAPPLIGVPSGAVVIDSTWQMLDLVASNSFWPACLQEGGGESAEGPQTMQRCQVVRKIALFC